MGLIRLLIILLLPVVTLSHLHAADDQAGTSVLLPELVDQIHADLSIAVIRPFERFDSFFGDQRLNEDTRRSRLDTAIGIRYDRFDESTLLTDVRLRIALPRMEDRFQLFLDETFAVDSPARETEIVTAAENSTPDVGLRYFFPRTGRWTLRGDLGGRLGSNPQLLLRLRGSRAVAVGSWDMYLSQSLFWLTRDRWGESSELRWSRPLADQRLFRTLTRLSWSQSEPGVTPYQGVELFGTVNPRLGYRFGLSASFPGTPHTTHGIYSLSSFLRYRFHSTWLFLDGGGGVEFPQIHGYNPNPFVILKVEAIFQ